VEFDVLGVLLRIEDRKVEGRRSRRWRTKERAQLLHVNDKRVSSIVACGRQIKCMNTAKTVDAPLVPGRDSQAHEVYSSLCYPWSPVYRYGPV
jgi:hypothetical protein